MISFIADVHVDNYPKWGGVERAGINERGRQVLLALDTAVGLSLDGPLVIAGDLFNRVHPTPPLIAAVQQILEQHPSCFIIKGNHEEESSAYGHNALAPLAPVVNVVERPRIYTFGMTELWLVPFKAGPAREWLSPALQELYNKTGKGVRDRLLAVHMGLSDPKTPYYLDQSAGSMNVKELGKLCKRFDVTHVFAGDWHRHQVWRHNGVKMVQIGALCPNRFPPNYEHGHRGTLVQLSKDGLTVQEIPGPRFYKKRWSMLDPTWRPDSWASPAYLKLIYRSDQAADAREWAEALKVELGLLNDGGKLGGIEYEVDRGIEQVKAKTASFEARKASSLDEAIVRYVDKMHVDEGVDRDEIRANVRRLLG